MKRPALPIREFLVGLGSNYQAEQWLPWALAQLRQRFDPVRHSEPEYTRDVNTAADQPLAATYLNAAARVRCDWPGWRFARLLKSLELQAGRSPALKAAGLVRLDLDLLGRAIPGQPWKWQPRRQRELCASYLQTHLRQVLQ